MLPRSLLQIVPLILPAALFSTRVTCQPAAGFEANLGIFTDDNLLYYTYINVGGEKFKVQVDTGSTDLYLKLNGRNIRYVNTTNIQTTETYGIGNATGTIEFSDMHLGSYAVSSQAFLSVESDDVPSADGVMGFSFDDTAIFGALANAWGNESALALGKGPGTNIFAANPSLPNFFDLRLGRADTVAGTPGKGDFYIAEHSPDYQGISDAPKLWPPGANGHWSVVLDGMTINGQPFAFNKSVVDGVPAGKTVAVLDSGFSIPGLPAAAIAAIYQSIPGAVYSQFDNSWIVPCNATVPSLAFTFGDVEVPIHPSDVAFVTTSPAIVNGTHMDLTICASGFSELHIAFEAIGFDIILGDSFLRNVYASFNYGVGDSTNNNQSGPYVQMLPTTTNMTTAWDEFNAGRRLAYAKTTPLSPDVYLRDYAPFTTPDTNSTTAAGSSPSTSGAAPTDTASGGAAYGGAGDDTEISGALSTDGDSDAKKSTPDSKYGLAAVGLLAANLVIGLVLLGVTLTMCIRAKGKSGARYTPVKFKEVVDNDPEGGPLRYSD